MYQRVMAATLVIATGIGSRATAKPPATQAQTVAAEDAEWRYYGADASSTRYSPLSQIDGSNVAELEIAWRWKTENFGPRPDFNYRVTPLMVDGVLYATAGSRRVVSAIDAATGETLWIYRIDEGERFASAPRKTSGRGVAFWDDGINGRIIHISPAYQMIALDATSGQLVPNFGRDGFVDLRENLGRDGVDPLTARIGSSTPPIIVNDVIVVGAALPSGGSPPSMKMVPAPVRGYDVSSGELLWSFNTIPHAGEDGNETWKNDSWTYTGNAAVWTSSSADPELGYVYLPIESGTHDYYGGHRLGDNLFTQSIVCLDARTGERVWHFQTVHHGIWDYDPPHAPILFDHRRDDGAVVPSVALVTKQTFTFVFDRRTGEPIWPIEERPVPPTDVPGEVVSPTQPFPTKPAPFDRQGVMEADLIDLTPELRKEAFEIAGNYTLGPMYTPPTLVTETNKGTLTLRGALGGANWPSAALDPETSLLYVSSATDMSVRGLVHQPKISDMNYVLGRRLKLPQNGGPQGLPLVKPPWGGLRPSISTPANMCGCESTAIRPTILRKPSARRVELAPTGKPDRGGLLVTKTLLFAGEGGGMFAAFGSGGPKFRAHDKRTGEVLHELELPANQTGTPMSYFVNGQQYVVVAVGAINHPAELVALRLPD